MLTFARSDDRELFARLWRYIEKHPGAFQIPDLDRTPHSQPWRHVLYIECLEVVRWLRPGFKPVIRCGESSALRAETSRGAGAVLIYLHGKLGAAHYRFLADQGLAFTIIAYQFAVTVGRGTDQETQTMYVYARARELGLDSEFDVIHSDADCLINARRALTTGRIVSCAPDRDERPDERTDDSAPIVIEPGLFEFCRRMKVPVFYTAPSVTADGAIDINLSGPHNYRREDDIAEIVTRFMAYAEAATGMKRVYRVATRARANPASDPARAGVFGSAAG